MNSKKYLFLDIDGVLNHEDWYDKIHKNPELCPGPFPFECFDPDCVRRVNEILKETGAELVISSSWRLDNELCQTFYKVGLPSEFKVTPYLKWTTGTKKDICRGDEIQAFLDKHHYNNYCIIDDDTDMLESQTDHFVQTAGEYWNNTIELVKENDGTGLTEKVKEKIINMLGLM